jgi:tetratricopeptide (TPR) repeat protein
MAFLAENRPADAIPAFKSALELKHDFLQAQHGLADALLLTGAYAEATEVYRGILAANPGDRRARLGLDEVERRRAGSRSAPR